jgi:4-amino-4-deoxychorismate lyase
MTPSGAASAATPQEPEGVWVNGRPAQAVSALERALHYGDGLFETIACIGHRPRFLERHLRRLASGCARLGFEPPDVAALRRELEELAAPADRAVLKLLVSRGVAAARGYGVTGLEKATRVTFRYGWLPDDPLLARDGVRVRVAALRLGENPHLAGLKHCNRLEQVLARREVSAAGLAEALLFSSSGALVSGTMSNVFLVLEGTLCTPRLDRCGVAGIMREVVCELAGAAGIALEERALGAGDLEKAGEVFLSNALIGIRPVREIDGRTLAAGPLTRALQERLAPLLAAGRTAQEARVHA